ncbi:SseB family protein [Dactylosporangium sp. McL0621]|uniref:SseB family protein n=1 Tax=Dactylosporangium sp. McL0621 TaxID=3415678 RepID=UPI003CED3634
MFDRPGFSRLDIESPEADETPAKPFGDLAAGARSAGFGRSDLDEHPFFADEPEPEPEAEAEAEAEASEPAPGSWMGSAWENSAPTASSDQQQSEPAFSAWDARPSTELPPENAAGEGAFFTGRAEVPSPFFQPPAEPPRSFFGDGDEAPGDPQRPFFDDEPPAPPFNAFTESRSDDPPIRDPYAALADLRSEPDAAQPSFASGVDALAEHPPVDAPAEPAATWSEPTPRPAENGDWQESSWIDTRSGGGTFESTTNEDEKENTGSFFLSGSARDAEPSPTPEPSPSLRSFFEDGEAERPDFQQAVVQDLPKPDAELETEAAGGPGFRPVIEDSLPSTGPGYQAVAEESQDAGFSWAYQSEPVYEPEIVDDVPVRLHDEIVDAEVVTPPAPEASVPEAEFHPANTVEKDLFEAVQANSTDRFLSTLLLAKVLIPFWTGDGPVEPANWRTEHMNGLPHLVVFTSQERMSERLGEDARGSWIKFARLIRQWPPGDQLAFAINPESPSGAVLPGAEVIQLASWAAEMGLGADDPDEQPVAPAAAPEPPPEKRPAYEPPGTALEQVMQKPISPEQLSYYLERNYDRVSGFVHRAGEVAHLETPEQIYNALGLGYAGSSFKPDADEAYVLRWIAYRGDLYRIPYGGSSQEAMRAMEGWVIERPPFRGNGFAPSETNDVIAEFKVDSARLPHNAELWRLRRDGRQDLIARLDADGPAWRKAIP